MTERKNFYPKIQKDFKKALSLDSTPIKLNKNYNLLSEKIIPYIKRLMRQNVKNHSLIKCLLNCFIHFLFENQSNTPNKDDFLFIIFFSSFYNKSKELSDNDIKLIGLKEFVKINIIKNLVKKNVKKTF